MSWLSDELKKKKKNVKRSRQGNTMKQSSKHNPDGKKRAGMLILPMHRSQKIDITY